MSRGTPAELISRWVQPWGGGLVVCGACGNGFRNGREVDEGRTRATPSRGMTQDRSLNVGLTMTPLIRITERVNRNGDVNDPATLRPMLTLEEFFEGNDVVGSMCANCTPTPTPREVYETLRRI